MPHLFANTILFDLDGTLLPMDQDLFVSAYLKSLAGKLASRGYAPEPLTRSILGGLEAMVKNDGTKTNEAVFWEYFTGIWGKQALEDMPLFEDYYHTDFQKLRSVCGFDPSAADLVRQLKRSGLRVVLATNPIFPAAATHSRIRWAGLEPEDFDHITTYENACFSKPNPAYYQRILERFSLTPDECAMVGNDVDEDMIAEEIGVRVFLLTDCLINKTGADLSRWPHGGFRELSRYLARVSGVT